MSVSGRHDITLTMDNAGLVTGLQQALNRIEIFGKEGAGAVKGLTGAFGNMESALGSLAAPLALLGSILGGGKLFKESVTQTVEYVKELGKLSRTLGVSAQAAAILNVAIGDIYGDVDAFVAGAMKMTKVLSTNEQQVKALGVATRDQNGKWRDTPALIADINAKLGTFEAGTVRNIEASKIYGRNYQDMLKFIELTPEVMLAAKIKTDELGLSFTTQEKVVLSGYRAAMNDAEDALRGLSKAVGLAVMPELTKLGKWFESVGPAVIKITVSGLEALSMIVKNTGVQFIAFTLLVTKAWAALSASTMFGGAITSLKLMGMYLLDGAAGFRVVTSAVWANTTALLANPLFWIVGVIGGVIAVLSYMSQAEEKATEKRIAANKSLADQKNSLLGYRDAAVSVDSVLSNSNSTDKEKANALDLQKTLRARLISQYPEYIGLIEEEIKKNTSNLDIILKVNAAKNADLVRTAKIEIEQTEKIIEVQKEKEALARKTLETTERTRMEVTEGGIFEVENRKWVLLQSELRKTTEEIKRLKTILDPAQASLLALQTTPEKKSGPDGTPGKEARESALAAVKAGLAKERYEYEKAAYDRGQLLEYTKEQEATYLQKSLNNFQGSIKERKQLEQLLFEAKRDIMKKEQDEKQKAIYEEMKLDKFNFDAKKALATKAYAESSNAAERAKALAALKAVHDEEREAQKKHNEEILSGQRQHEAAMRSLKMEAVNAERALGDITELEALKRIALIKRETFEAEKAILEEKKRNAGLDKALAQKHTNDLMSLEDKYKTETIKDRAQLTRELLRLNPFASLNTMAKKFMDDSRDKLRDWGSMALKVMNAAEAGIDNALQGMIKGTMTFGEGIKSIFTSIGDAVLQTITGMIANWVVAQAAAIIFTATVETTENIKASAALDTAVAETFAAYASIPFIGMGLAMAQIALMMGEFTVMKLANKAATAFATGGLVDKPTMGLVGEAGTEYIVPESDFKSLMPSLMSQGASIYQAMLGTSKNVNNYSRQSSSYSPSTTQVRNSKQGPVFNITTALGDKRELAKTIKNLLNRDTVNFGCAI